MADTDARLCAFLGASGALKGGRSSTTGALVGESSPAISFVANTSGRAVVADAPSLDPALAITLEAWINPSPAGTGNRTILAKDKQYFLRLQPDNRLDFRVWIGEPELVGEMFDDLITKDPISTDGTWKHVAGTYRVFPDGREEERLYLDGQQVAGYTFAAQGGLSWTKGLASSTNSLYVGARGDYWDNFQGSVDEPAVYSEKALSAAQVGQHYSLGRDIPDTTITLSPGATQTPTPTSSSLSSATFQFVGTRSPTGFQCRFDRGTRHIEAGWQACSSPVTLSGLPSALHSFEVRAYSARGKDPTPARHVWTITGCALDSGSFDIGRWPSACWRPYAATSPFNRPLPTAPRLHARSAQIVAKLMTFCEPDHLKVGDCEHAPGGKGEPGNIAAGWAGTAEDFAHPIYYSRSSDPWVTLTCDMAGSWGDCGGLNHKSIQIPAAAQPAGWAGNGEVDLLRTAGTIIWRSSIRQRASSTTCTRSVYGPRPRSRFGMGELSRSTATAAVAARSRPSGDSW
ncbi:MAG TPA: LamG domain-containing protein [Solirubrobacteraceae bacterium]